MSLFLASTRKDLARWRQDTNALLLFLAIPLLIGGLITVLMSGSGGAKPHGTVLIVDQDDTFLSGVIAGAFGQGELGELLTVKKVTVEDGMANMDAGEASGLLIIPKGFTDAFFDKQPVTLILKTNPAQTILPGIISDVTEILLDAGFYAQQLFGEDIATIRDGNLEGLPDDVFVSAIAVSIQHKIEASGSLLFPPAMDIDIVPPPPEQPRIPYALLFLPGVILLALMFAANGLASDYWEEREHGTLRRLVYAPGQLTAFLAGKALAAGLVITLIGGVTLVIGFLYHGIAWSKLPSSLAWIAISGVALFSWFGALQMLAGNRRSGNLITSMLLFPLLMAGGSFFPFAALPDWIAALGRRTPNGFIADRLTTEITSATTWAIDIQSWLIVSTMAVLGLALCAWRLQTGFARN